MAVSGRHASAGHHRGDDGAHGGVGGGRAGGGAGRQGAGLASGAHFNPVVTAADWLLGRRTPPRYSLGLAAAVMACQVAGAIAGAAG